MNLSDADSGVGPDSSNSSRNPSVDGNPLMVNVPEISNICYMWMVENCILSVYNQNKIICPLHFEIDVQKVAPDVVSIRIYDFYYIKTKNQIFNNLFVYL